MVGKLVKYLFEGCTMGGKLAVLVGIVVAVGLVAVIGGM